MEPLPLESTDAELIAFVDEWARLLEQEDYEAAHAHTDHVKGTQWTPELIREVIKAYGERGVDNLVTLEGEPTDITQNKEVHRRQPAIRDNLGYIWYDLNINGFASDLTATFDLTQARGGISVQLSDIHVM